MIVFLLLLIILIMLFGAAAVLREAGAWLLIVGIVVCGFWFGWINLVIGLGVAFCVFMLIAHLIDFAQGTTEFGDLYGTKNINKPNIKQ